MCYKRKPHVKGPRYSWSAVSGEWGRRWGCRNKHEPDHSGSCQGSVPCHKANGEPRRTFQERFSFLRKDLSGIGVAMTAFINGFVEIEVNGHSNSYFWLRNILWGVSFIHSYLFRVSCAWEKLLLSSPGLYNLQSICKPLQLIFLKHGGHVWVYIFFLFKKPLDASLMNPNYPGACFWFHSAPDTVALPPAPWSPC